MNALSALGVHST